MMVFCIAGKIGSGKTTITSILEQVYNFKKLSFVSHVIEPYIIKYNDNVNRQTLQQYGIKLLKNKGELWMIKQLTRRIVSNENYVIDDVRYFKTALIFQQEFSSSLI